MKILYIVLDSAPYGSNKALLNLLELVAPKDVTPIVVVAKTGGFTELLKQKDIPFFQLRFYYSIYPKLRSFRDYLFFFPILFRTLLFNCLAVRSLVRMVKEFEIDIIHTNIGPLHIGYEVSKRTKIPHVWHIREYQDLYFGWHPLFSKKSFEKKLRSKYCYPISITKGLYRHYSMKDNAKVIYDGVMQESQKQFAQNKGKYFLFVGRLEESKGVRQLIEVFIDFAKSEKEYQLMIAGDGAEDYKNDLFNIVNSVGLSDRVNFLGFRKDISNLMANATALIVPSNFEGFGFTTVEAMFNGCLVIGNNSGGTTEILEQEKLGLLYSNNQELKDTMHRVVVDGIAKYYAMIKRAQDVATRLYTCETNAQEIYAFYIDVLARRSHNGEFKN